MDRRYYSIDALRTVAIVSVILIHTRPFYGWAGSIGYTADFAIDTFSRFAVPFFFIVSGYLFAAKIRETSVVEYYPRYAKRIVAIYVLGTLLALPVAIVQDLGQAILLDEPFVSSIGGLLSPLGLLYYGDSVSTPLWFLTALLYSVTLVAVFEYYGKTRLLVPLSACLYLVGILGQLPTPLVPIETRDALFYGLFCVVLGVGIQHRTDGRDVGHSRLWLGLFGLFSLAHIGSRYLIGYVYGPFTGLAGEMYTAQFTYLTVFPALFLLLFALSAPDWGDSSVLSRLGKYSLGVYIVHPPLVGLVHAFMAGIDALYSIDLTSYLAWHLAFTPLVFVISVGIYVLLGSVGIVDRFYRFEGKPASSSPTHALREALVGSGQQDS